MDEVIFLYVDGKEHPYSSVDGVYYLLLEHDGEKAGIDIYFMNDGNIFFGNRVVGSILSIVYRYKLAELKVQIFYQHIIDMLGRLKLGYGKLQATRDMGFGDNSVLTNNFDLRFTRAPELHTKFTGGIVKNTKPVNISDPSRLLGRSNHTRPRPAEDQQTNEDIVLPDTPAIRGDDDRNEQTIRARDFYISEADLLSYHISDTFRLRDRQTQRALGTPSQRYSRITLRNFGLLAVLVYGISVVSIIGAYLLLGIL